MFMMKLDEKYILWMLVLHLYGHWLSRLTWPYGETFSYCKCTTYFHGLNSPPNRQIHKQHYALMFYLYVNKYVAPFQRKIQLSGFSAHTDGHIICFIFHRKPFFL